MENPLIFHSKVYNKLGDTFLVNSLNGADLILTRNSEFIQHVLQKNHKNYEKSTLQTVDLAKYIGHGLLTSNGKHWLTHRRMIQPGFSKKKLQGLLTIIRDAVTYEVGLIETGNTIDAYPIMSDLAFQTVAKSLFSAGDIRGKMSELQGITQAAQTMLIKELRQPYLRWWFRMSGNLERHIRMGDDARKLLGELVLERRLSEEDNDDLLDMLLGAKYDDGEPMSENQLLDEVMILFTAGHETTANALSFVLFHIAQNKEIEKKIFDEVSGFDFGDDNLMNVFKELEYTSQCIEEAMRLYPPAYMVDRVAIGDDQIGGFHVPAGTMILLSMYELQRDSRYWTDTETFEPSRFSKENKIKNAGRYFPFGAGPRMCVGNHFAMFEMIVAIASIVKEYRLSTDTHKIKLVPLVSLKPKEVPIKFTRR